MQPGDGYIDPSQFKLQRLDDGKLLNKHKNILPTIIGLTVDYLTRFAMTGDILEAFKNSCKGVWIAVNRFKQKSALITAKKLLLNIKGLYNDSVINACKMVTYGGWYRNPKAAKSGIGVEDINPDLKTIENIQVMVERCLKFLEEFGPIIQDDFTFEPHGYTETVDNGDGDYLTANTLWDFKVSKYNPTNINSIQLLMYWIMGQHSGQRIYNKIKKLGIFNPRLNSVFTLDVSDLNPEVIEAAERDVICY